MMSRNSDAQPVAGESEAKDIPPISAELLQSLFARMSVMVDKRRLHKASEAAFANSSHNTVLQSLSAVLKDVGVSDLQVRQTLWSRMDQPQYPLLVARNEMEW